jgi:hypothetical protein
MRRVGRYNLRDGLAADPRQDQPTLRTRPTRRPREDIFLPEQNALSLAYSFSVAGSGNRRNGGAVLAPAELATVDPHPVQNHGQAPRDRDDGSALEVFRLSPHGAGSGRLRRRGCGWIRIQGGFDDEGAVGAGFRAVLMRGCGRSRLRSARTEDGRSYPHTCRLRHRSGSAQLGGLC